MTREEWEAICDKCGKCCYEKVDLGCGEIRYTDEPCQHLDTRTGLCKIYENRHEIEPDCISLTEELVRTLHWLPEGCAYVRYIRFQDTVAAIRAAERKRQRGRPARRNR
ncbi:MAG: YkgJ family cysteine cluster protein [Desulfomonile sp.]|nr:YkgJ family cysteine cluster protein [Desulfomonile sp.]